MQGYVRRGTADKTAPERACNYSIVERGVNRNREWAAIRTERSVGGRGKRRFANRPENRIVGAKVGPGTKDQSQQERRGARREKPVKKIDNVYSIHYFSRLWVEFGHSDSYFYNHRSSFKEEAAMVKRTISIVWVLALLTAGVVFGQGVVNNPSTTSGENSSFSGLPIYIAPGGTPQLSSGDITVGGVPVPQSPSFQLFDASSDINAGENALYDADSTSDPLLYALYIGLAVLALVAAFEAIQNGNT